MIQAIESIWFQLLKGFHNHIGLKILTVVAYPNAPHAGAARSLNTRSGVFHYGAPLGRNAESGSG